MSRYKLKRDLISIQGANFFKDEIVEGSLNPDGLHIDIVRDNKSKKNINTLINYSDVEKVSKDTPLTDDAKVKEYVSKSNKTIATSMSIGALGGLSLAYFKKQGFLEYVAFTVLGSIAGLLIGNEINKRRKIDIIPVIDSKDNKENINEK
jgi:hypothetical protein